MTSAIVACAYAISTACKALAHAHVLYLGGLGVVGAARRGTQHLRRAQAASPTSAPEPLRFALLVLAHDEEAVIAHTVASLLAQDYPREAFEVVVVADNCTDATADRARDAGATVLVRGSGGPVGKGAALDFALDWSVRQGRFDAAAVFDADNHVDAGFLRPIAARLAAGEQVVQGVVDALDPDASWVAASSALGFWSLAVTSQAPREGARLSAAIMGTGWAARLELHAAKLLFAEGLADDAEIGARLALAGVRVAYEPRARVFDEKPHRLDTALSQRRRWMQGRAAVAVRYVGRLLRFATHQATGASRWRALDLTLQLVAPTYLFTAVALAALGALELVAGVDARAAGIPFVLSPIATLTAGVAYYVAPAVGIARFRPPARTWLAYFAQPFYVAFSIPLAVIGLRTLRERRWSHTRHGASPSLRARRAGAPAVGDP